MHIGVVTTSYPRFTGDPAGNFVEEHVRALRGLGHMVSVIAAGDGEPELEAREHVIRVPSPLFYRGGAPDEIERSFVRSTLASASFTARLAATVARHGRSWDAVVAHWLVPSAIAALPLEKPLLAIAHGGDIHTLRATGLLRPTLRLLRRARLVFVTRELQRLAGGIGEVIPMGFDRDRFHAIPRTPTTPPTILAIGRLVRIKGFDVALRARAHLRTPARLVIAGDGPRRGELERAHPEVTFLGAVDTEARDRLLATASVVVVPSRILKNGRSEGSPLVALEALASGVPVVASEVGGLRDLPVVRVPPEEPRALAAAIDRVLADPPAPAELRRSIDHLAWSNVAPRLVPS